MERERPAATRRLAHLGQILCVRQAVENLLRRGGAGPPGTAVALGAGLRADHGNVPARPRQPVGPLDPAAAQQVGHAVHRAHGRPRVAPGPGPGARVCPIVRAGLIVRAGPGIHPGLRLILKVFLVAFGARAGPGTGSRPNDTKLVGGVLANIIEPTLGAQPLVVRQEHPAPAPFLLQVPQDVAERAVSVSLPHLVGNLLGGLPGVPHVLLPATAVLGHQPGPGRHPRCLVPPGEVAQQELTEVVRRRVASIPCRPARYLDGGLDDVVVVAVLQAGGQPQAQEPAPLRVVCRHPGDGHVLDTGGPALTGQDQGPLVGLGGGHGPREGQ